MKKELTIFTFMFLTFILRPQGSYDTYTGFTVPVTPILPSSESHPSLWFNSSQITDLKNKKNADAYSAQIWVYVSNKITSYKSMTVSNTSTSDRPILAKTLAFAWLMNEDATAKQKAIDALMIAYDNVPRTATSANFDGDYDEIYRATWLQNYCTAYDWLKSQLTSAQDSIIRAKIVEEVLLLRNNMTTGITYAPRPHNHRSKPAYALITAALTFSSDSRASGWLQYALTQLNTVTKYMYSADGIYREGSHYNLYSLVNGIPALWHYKNVSGVDHFPYYKSVFEMPVKLRNSKGWQPNIEDSYVKPFPTQMVAAAYNNSNTSLHPSEPLSKILQWNWFNTNFFDHNYTGATNDATWDIDEYLTYDPAIVSVNPIFDSNIKTSSGIVVFRNTEQLSDTPSKYMLFHGVAESDNHQHPDLLSYIIEYKGTILSTDAGYGKDGYSDSKRAWYVSPDAHNTLTVSDAAPLDITTNVPPINLHYINSPYYVFAEKQARTIASNGKLRRSISFPDKNFWVVSDIGYAINNANYKMFIHSRGTMSRTDKKITWTTTADKYGTAQRLYSFVITSEPDSIFSRSGYTSLYKDEVSQGYVEVKQMKDTVLFMHLLYPDSAVSSFPVVTDISTNKFIGFGLSTDYNQNYFTLQKKNDLIEISLLSTDALYTWSKTEGSSLKAFAFNEGKRYMYQNKQIISLTNYATLSCRFLMGENEIYFDTLVQNTTVNFIPSFSTDSISYVMFNGSIIPFTVSGNAITFSIIGAGKLSVKSSAAVSVKNEIFRPINFMLFNNYPNPFNPNTKLDFQVFKQSKVKIQVYNSIGKLIKEIFNESVPAGVYSTAWDGLNNSGEKVPSGMYIFEISDGFNFQRKKGVLLK